MTTNKCSLPNINSFHLAAEKVFLSRIFITSSLRSKKQRPSDQQSVYQRVLCSIVHAAKWTLDTLILLHRRSLCWRAVRCTTANMPDGRGFRHRTNGSLASHLAIRLNNSYNAVPDTAWQIKARKRVLWTAELISIFKIYFFLNLRRTHTPASSSHQRRHQIITLSKLHYLSKDDYHDEHNSCYPREVIADCSFKLFFSIFVCILMWFRLVWWIGPTRGQEGGEEIEGEKGWGEERGWGEKKGKGALTWYQQVTQPCHGADAPRSQRGANGASLNMNSGASYDEH